LLNTCTENDRSPVYGGMHTRSDLSLSSSKTGSMNITYPHVIQNCVGEKLIFQKIEKHLDGDKVFVENYITPGNGPQMHTHLQQDESLTVIKGKLGYEIEGQPVQYAEEGETVLFKRGIPHRFWNAGQEMLHCNGWIKPANTIVFFLSAFYDAQNKSGKAEPEQFDSAFLIKRYRKEYDLPGISRLLKKTIIPITYYTGKLLGKYKHFKNAPKPEGDYVNYYL
jgi:quercetin dioxygenase-like cupin family protein